jgi:DNA-binding XRE family transcriptional regulator
MNAMLRSMSPDEFRHSMRYLGCRTQAQMGEQIGVHRSTIGSWLLGKTGVPRHICLLIRLLIAERKP